MSQYGIASHTKNLILTVYEWPLLTLSMLGKHFSILNFEICFLIFPRKQDLIVHANCLHRRQFACNVKFCFLGKKIMSLLSAEFAQSGKDEYRYI